MTAVQADSPAMLAGMKEYDVVVKIGEDEISKLPAVPGSAGSADAGADCDSHRYAPGSGRIRGGRIRGHSGRDLTRQKRQRKIKEKEESMIMKYIKEFREGMRAAGIYLCKFRQSAVTKNGKPYENVILQDKTGTIDAKIWEPNSVGIDEFDSLDYIDIVGDVTSFAGALQVSHQTAAPGRRR